MQYRIGIVAGEASGDLLGAGLIAALKKQYPDAEIEGIAGQRMIAQGVKTLVPMESIAVMGIVEVLKHYWSLRAIQKKIIRHFKNNPPDIFIGIDAPDFNLPIEGELRKQGIKTVHYVSPSVWAWRKKRLNKMVGQVDCMLTLFPFETACYEEKGIISHCVGHPLADMIPLETNPAGAKKTLGLEQHENIIGVLPGSRSNEVKLLAPCFAEAMFVVHQKTHSTFFVIPLTDEKHITLFKQSAGTVLDNIPHQFLLGQSHQVLEAAKLVLTASGTASLEALLYKKPMVVAYKLSNLTYRILKHLVSLPYVSLPNLLAKKALVPEFIQDEATGENLGAAMLGFLQKGADGGAMITEFGNIHQKLKRNANQQAAKIIGNILEPCKAGKSD